MTPQVQTDRTLVREAGNSIRYVLLSFTAPQSTRVSTREPVNVAFVIDRSGSMAGSKIALARTALVQAIRMLKPTDRFAVVCYDDQVDVVVPSTLATAEAIRNAVVQVEALQARGSTDLGGGWLKGCEWRQWRPRAPGTSTTSRRPNRSPTSSPANWGRRSRSPRGTWRSLSARLTALA
jgi:Mg-chelatase subunit ChlD